MKSLSKRIWRYHSYGYKIKKPTFYRFLKLCLKQLKFFSCRLIENLIKLNFFFIYISFVVLIDFIKLEFINSVLYFMGLVGVFGGVLTLVTSEYIEQAIISIAIILISSIAFIGGVTIEKYLKDIKEDHRYYD